MIQNGDANETSNKPLDNKEDQSTKIKIKKMFNEEHIYIRSTVNQTTRFSSRIKFENEDIIIPDKIKIYPDDDSQIKIEFEENPLNILYTGEGIPNKSETNKHLVETSEQIMHNTLNIKNNNNSVVTNQISESNSIKVNANQLSEAKYDAHPESEHLLIEKVKRISGKRRSVQERRSSIKRRKTRKDDGVREEKSVIVYTTRLEDMRVLQKKNLAEITFDNRTILKEVYNESRPLYSNTIRSQIKNKAALMPRNNFQKNKIDPSIISANSRTIYEKNINKKFISKSNTIQPKNYINGPYLLVDNGKIDTQNPLYEPSINTYVSPIKTIPEQPVQNVITSKIQSKINKNDNHKQKIIINTAYNDKTDVISTNLQVSDSILATANPPSVEIDIENNESVKWNGNEIDDLEQMIDCFSISKVLPITNNNPLTTRSPKNPLCTIPRTNKSENVMKIVTKQLDNEYKHIRDTNFYYYLPGKINEGDEFKNVTIEIVNVREKLTEIYETDENSNVVKFITHNACGMRRDTETTKTIFFLRTCCWYHRKRCIESLFPKNSTLSRFMRSTHKPFPEDDYCCSEWNTGIKKSQQQTNGKFKLRNSKSTFKGLISEAFKYKEKGLRKNTQQCQVSYLSNLKSEIRNIQMNCSSHDISMETIYIGPKREIYSHEIILQNDNNNKILYISDISVPVCCDVERQKNISSLKTYKVSENTIRYLRKYRTNFIVCDTCNKKDILRKGNIIPTKPDVIHSTLFTKMKMIQLNNHHHKNSSSKESVINTDKQILKLKLYENTNLKSYENTLFTKANMLKINKPGPKNSSSDIRSNKQMYNIKIYEKTNVKETDLSTNYELTIISMNIKNVNFVFSDINRQSAISILKAISRTRFYVNASSKIVAKIIAPSSSCAMEILDESKIIQNVLRILQSLIHTRLKNGFVVIIYASSNLGHSTSISTICTSKYNAEKIFFESDNTKTASSEILPEDNLLIQHVYIPHSSDTFSFNTTDNSIEAHSNLSRNEIEENLNVPETPPADTNTPITEEIEQNELCKDNLKELKCNENNSGIESELKLKIANVFSLNEETNSVCDESNNYKIINLTAQPNEIQQVNKTIESEKLPNNNIPVQQQLLQFTKKPIIMFDPQKNEQQILYIPVNLDMKDIVLVLPTKDDSSNTNSLLNGQQRTSTRTVSMVPLTINQPLHVNLPPYVIATQANTDFITPNNITEPSPPNKNCFT